MKDVNPRAIVYALNFYFSIFEFARKFNGKGPKKNGEFKLQVEGAQRKINVCIAKAAYCFVKFQSNNENFPP